MPGRKLGPWSEFPFLYRFTVLLNSGSSTSPWSEFWSEFPHFMGMGVVPAPLRKFVLNKDFSHKLRSPDVPPSLFRFVNSTIESGSSRQVANSYARTTPFPFSLEEQHPPLFSNQEWPHNACPLPGTPLPFLQPSNSRLKEPTR